MGDKGQQGIQKAGVTCCSVYIALPAPRQPSLFITRRSWKWPQISQKPWGSGARGETVFSFLARDVESGVERLTHGEGTWRVRYSNELGRGAPAHVALTSWGGHSEVMSESGNHCYRQPSGLQLGDTWQGGAALIKGLGKVTLELHPEPTCRVRIWGKGV